NNRSTPRPIPYSPPPDPPASTRRIANESALADSPAETCLPSPPDFALQPGIQPLRRSREPSASKNRTPTGPRAGKGSAPAPPAPDAYRKTSRRDSSPVAVGRNFRARRIDRFPKSPNQSRSPPAAPDIAADSAARSLRAALHPRSRNAPRAKP